MNGYVKLDIGGKERGFKFGNYVIGMTIKDLGVNMVEFDKIALENPFLVFPVLMYHAAAYNEKTAKRIVDFDQMDVNVWIDEIEGGLNSPVMSQFSQAFVEAVHGIKTDHSEQISTITEESKKKKVTSHSASK